ncbi:glycine-rich protein [uncultured Shewanella sp.]|uniref:glycine-rich protein n=1 Tax=uncultured Shewanella sp. TaxID=173975 RepID=UPI002603225C|nr:glycine-rich protein [uncultured Shewanella sp.]
MVPKLTFFTLKIQYLDPSKVFTLSLISSLLLTACNDEYRAVTTPETTYGDSSSYSQGNFNANEQCELIQTDTEESNILRCTLPSTETTTNLWHDVYHSINHDIDPTHNIRASRSSPIMFIAKGADGGDTDNHQGGRGSIGIYSTTFEDYYETYQTYEVHWAQGQSGSNTTSITDTGDEIMVGGGGAATYLMTQSPLEHSPSFSNVLISAGGGGGASPNSDGGSGSVVYSRHQEAVAHDSFGQEVNIDVNDHNHLGGAGGCVDSTLDDYDLNASLWHNLDDDKQKISINDEGNGACAYNHGGSGGGGYSGGAAAEDMYSPSAAGGTYVAASQRPDFTTLAILEQATFHPPHKDSSWWDDFTDAVDDAWDDVTDTAEDVVDDIYDAAEDEAEGIVELLIAVGAVEDDPNDVGYNYDDPVVIFDIDGTVIDDGAQEDYFNDGYDGFSPTFWETAKDTVDEYIANGFQVVFLTGRPEDGIVYPDGYFNYIADVLSDPTSVPDSKTFATVTQEWLEDNLTISEGGLEWDVIMYPYVIDGSLDVGDSDAVKDFKIDSIQDYAEAVGIDPDDSDAMGAKFIYAFSSSDDDIEAYEDAGIPSSNIEQTDDDSSAFDEW